MEEEDVAIEAEPGARLEGRLAVHSDARGGLVICHPHPLYGGDMDNPVVTRAAEVAQESGVSTLRFNFRGVGRSTGVHGKGEAELRDVEAALGLLRARLPAPRPIGLGGYSFGAWVAARLASSGDRDLAALGLVAPPLRMYDLASLDTRRLDVLIAAGTRDEYCPPDKLAALTARLSGADIATIEGADHFFFGKLFPLGESIRRWVSRWTAA